MPARNPTPRRGFTCPSCGTPMRVRKTRPAGPGQVRRRRRCPRCRHSVTTVERPVAGATGDPPVTGGP